MKRKKPTNPRDKIRFHKTTAAGKKKPDLSAQFVYYWEKYTEDYTGYLPTLHTEVKVIKHRRFQSDIAFPEFRLAVEIDGGTWLSKGGYHGSDSDREKLNLYTLAGWRIMRYSADMMLRCPEQMIDQITQVLSGIREGKL